MNIRITSCLIKLLEIPPRREDHPSDLGFHYIGSTEGHEYPDLQVGVAARSLIIVTSNLPGVVRSPDCTHNFLCTI